MNETDRSADTEHKKTKDTGYEKIINLPRHISKERKKMSISDRAAQFASFQALTGFGEEIEETARLTDNRGFVAEEREYLINEALNKIVSDINKKPFAEITYFKADGKKQGGAYITHRGNVRVFDEAEKIFIFTDGTKIPLGDIYSVFGIKKTML